MKLIAPLFLILIFNSCHLEPRKKEDHQIIEVKKVDKKPTIDGKGNENSWNMAKWHALDQNWLGSPYERDDFNGRFKLNWDENHLYQKPEYNPKQHLSMLQKYWPSLSKQCFEYL